MTNIHCELTGDAIDPARAIAAVSGPDCGAISIFIGAVREENEGRRVLFLEYEAYLDMAERVMTAIAEEAAARFAPCHLAMIHRTGRLELGEISVVVVAASPHRKEAIEACRHVIERIKATVPIWKKEHFEGGEVWIEGCTAGDHS